MSIHKKAFAVSILVVILVNEFTVVVFDPNPPLGELIKNALRILNFFTIITGVFWEFIPFGIVGRLLLKFSGMIAKYVMPTVLALLFLDVLLGLFGFGYPSHFEQENITRVPSPYDSFSGKPNVLDHNQYGFRGTFENQGKINVALFGGSTGYAGTPSIVEIIGQELGEQGIDVTPFNFSSISSNHTQHVHRLLKFHDKFNFDVVIFYGGGNETMQYVTYDPRIGYPYNFFFRMELNPLLQSLLRYSSIVGHFDLLTGSISGISTLRTITNNDEWDDKVVANYWRDLAVAKSITDNLVQPNVCEKTVFLSVTQPGNPSTKREKSIWKILKDSNDATTRVEDHLNLMSLEEEVKFTDIIHITQNARVLISKKISERVESLLRDNCKNYL